MGLFEHWPYTNFHDLNLDWIIKKLPEVFTASAQAQQSAETAVDAKDDAVDAKDSALLSAANAALSEEHAEQSASSAQNYAEHISDPVSGLVTTWLDDNITPTTPPVDASLTVQGAAADAKVTGDSLSELRSQIVGFEVIPYEVKNAMDILFSKMSVIDNDVYTEEYAAFHAWASEVSLVSISAAFTQGDNLIFTTDMLEDLKQYLTVTAHYNDGTDAVIQAYSLSGTLQAGTSSITVSYAEQTTSFTVDVTAATDVTPLLSTFINTTGTTAEYNSSSNSLRVYTTSNGTFRRSKTDATVTYGKSYRVTCDIAYVRGTWRVGYTADNTAKKLSPQATASGHVKMDYTPSAEDAGSIDNLSIYCTWSTSQAGDITVSNFKVIEYIMPE